MCSLKYTNSREFERTSRSLIAICYFYSKSTAVEEPTSFPMSSFFLLKEERGPLERGCCCFPSDPLRLGSNAEQEMAFAHLH